MKLRHQLTTFIKFCGYILFAVVGGYLLFPLWAGWLISGILPANLSLIEFESDYPGFADISINRMVLLRSGQKYSLEGLQLHYDLSDIKLDQVTLEFIGQSKSEQKASFQLSDLKLPELAVQDFSPLQQLQRVAIGQITVLNESHKFQFSQFELANPKPNDYAVKMSMLHPFNQTMVDLKLLLGLHAVDNKISLQVFNSRSLLLSMTQQQMADHVKIELKVDSESLQPLLPAQLSELGVKTKGNIEIQWLQDNLTDQTRIKIDSLLTVLPEQIEFLGVAVQSDEAHTSQNRLDIPLEFSLNSNLEQQARADLKLMGSVNHSLIINDPEMQINLGATTFDISTTLSSANFGSLVRTMKLENNHINLSGVDFKFQRRQSNIDLSRYQLKGEAENIELDFNNLENLKWRFKGVFSSPEIVGTLIKSQITDSKDPSSEDPSSKIYSSDSLKPGSIAQVASHQRDKSKILHLDSQLEVNFEVTKSDQIVTRGELLLSQLQVIDPNYKLNGPLEFNWQSVDTDLTQGSASLVFNSDENQVLGFDYDSLKVEADLSIESQQIKGEGKLSINQQSLAPFSFKFDKSTLGLIVELKKNQLANQLFNHFLAAFGKQNKMALEILAGEVVHAAGVGIDELLLLDSDFAIKDMLFKYEENQIHGLNVTQKLTSLNPLKLHSQIEIEKISFASGLSIDKISASLSSRSIEDISLNSVKADLLEGQLIADNLQIGGDLSKILPFHLKKISLTELIFMMDITGLYGEGKLDFYLPLSLEAGTVAISDGTFKATQEGLIKYSSGQEDSEVEENIALQALKNFHYKELDGTLSYNKLGEYHIKLHLLGANPDLYDGYPIDFVLNLRGELSGMFKSLFLTGNFEEAVMEQVKADQLEQN